MLIHVDCKFPQAAHVLQFVLRNPGERMRKNHAKSWSDPSKPVFVHLVSFQPEIKNWFGAVLSETDCLFAILDLCMPCFGLLHDCCQWFPNQVQKHSCHNSFGAKMITRKKTIWTTCTISNKKNIKHKTIYFQISLLLLFLIKTKSICMVHEEKAYLSTCEVNNTLIVIHHSNIFTTVHLLRIGACSVKWNIHLFWIILALIS